MDGSGIKLDYKNQPEQKESGQHSSVATLWTLTVGGEEQSYLSETLKDEPVPHDEKKQKSESKKTNRIISCFLQGLINIIADLLCGKGIFLNGLYPQTSYAVNTS